ncbi:hypothetical protein K493DRAFT_299918 [Basidiobolus meristosporus CBS 931.73]|uniref:Uncharacterized protein n=1 Tax=Basidiobolus meristosporus CBS 931.73 TaxID=1314790 RepID=A0A1Y1YL50_9FUNG|nr:hypothetical protein K493DRAFT_299918 [Basidiobolus meristosporus CBS 931.73]|eukprot:ORX98486.1 hypothetical protein K493DRAFT_299918 [Basidiobolus meristosporus CBS 931.73]
MFKYRLELREHAFEMISTISVVSLFLYPLVAGAIQIPLRIALPLAVRGVTAQLALNIETVLGGDLNTTAFTVSVTGILSAVGGQWFVQKLQFSKDNYIIIGVTLGCYANALWYCCKRT